MKLERPIVAAAAQVSPVFMKKKESIEKYAAAIEEAGRRGVDLLVTPETGIPTYPYWRNNFGYTSPESAALWKDTVVAFYDQSVRIPGPETDELCRAAESARLVAVIGLNEQDDREGSATLYNTMLFLDGDGTILGRHRKLMPTHQERFFWGRGDASDLRVFDTHFGKLGGLVCFENHMTLLKAAMAMKGEEIHAACWPGWWSYGGKSNSVRDMTGEVRPLCFSDQDSAIREYAFETQTFVVSASMYLPEDAVPDDFPYKKSASWKWAMGGSAIANPFGAYVREPVFHKEELVVAELDPRDRIVAKNVFDCMGHYSRWDVVSLRVRSEDYGPTGPMSPRRRITTEQIESVAARHELPADKVESILRDLESLSVEVEVS
ncbi:MAG TPA: carbon-nitrogen hydrolase family protein [Vicinamibacteria bacterium]|nr:carbon-nitrogen hydrolase family protein [Vicinamibacteria bacterium]